MEIHSAGGNAMVQQNSSSIIISAHHYVSGTQPSHPAIGRDCRDEKGQWKDWYHGYYEGKGSPRGASYLYWVDSKQDSSAFEDDLNASPGRVDLWLGAHTPPLRTTLTAASRTSNNDGAQRSSMSLG